MPARTICIASARGGSGKTTLVATFGTFLAGLGQSVLLIDADFATCGLTLLFLKEVQARAGLLRSRSREPAGLREAIAEPLACDEVELAEGLVLVPASYGLQPASVQASEITRQRLASLLQSVQNRFDFVLIDAQAGAAEMAQLAMSRKVAEEVVIVSAYDPVSAAGVERLRAQLREDLTSERTSILLNKVLPETKSFAGFVEGERLLSPVAWHAEISRCRPAMGTERDDHTLSVLRTLKDLCGERIRKPLEAWIQSRVEVVRQPLEDQYADAEKERALLISHRAQVQRRARFARWLGVLLLVTGLVGSAWILYSADQSGLAVEEVAPFLAATGAVAILGILRLFGREGAKAQGDSARLDRRLEVLNERLKRIELLRTLEPAVSASR